MTSVDMARSNRRTPLHPAGEIRAQGRGGGPGGGEGKWGWPDRTARRARFRRVSTAESRWALREEEASEKALR